jgi:predicted nucleic-acid-binding Zn-ribbon protein
MSDNKSCPKCQAPMQAGSLKETGQYGNSPFFFAPEGEPPFLVAGQKSARSAVVLYRCSGCGYLEAYAP